MGVLGLLPIGGVVLWIVAVAILLFLGLGLVVAEAMQRRSPA